MMNGTSNTRNTNYAGSISNTNPMSNVKETILCVVYLYLGILFLLMRMIGSSSCFPVIGIAFVSVTTIYMLINLVKIRRKPLRIKLVTGIMCISFLVMSETGIMIMVNGMDEALRSRHILSVVLFLISLVYHILQHRTKKVTISFGAIRNRVKRMKK